MIEEIAQKIKNLEIQGATNIALASLDAMKELSQKEFRDKSAFLAEARGLALKLANLRENEPLLRNVLSILLTGVENYYDTSFHALLDQFRRECDILSENIQLGKRNIARYGSKFIKDGQVILTHCHSSSVMHIIKEAAERGNQLTVITPEARPRYQGRISASELKDFVDVIMIVDSAVNHIMSEMHVDLVLVGADVVTAEGNLVNKIGTSQIAFLANHHGIPFYTAATLWKFDYSTIYGPPTIEHRDPSEIWDLKGIKIDNPAFDITNRQLIDMYITEEGALTPDGFISRAKNQIPRPNSLEIEDEIENKPSNKAIITDDAQESESARLKGYYVFSKNKNIVADVYFENEEELKQINRMRVLW